jgi:hypothetical protein
VHLLTQAPFLRAKQEDRAQHLSCIQIKTVIINNFKHSYIVSIGFTEHFHAENGGQPALLQLSEWENNGNLLGCTTQLNLRSNIRTNFSLALLLVKWLPDEGSSLYMSKFSFFRYIHHIYLLLYISIISFTIIYTTVKSMKIILQNNEVPWTPEKPFRFFLFPRKFFRFPVKKYLLIIKPETAYQWHHFTHFSMSVLMRSHLPKPVG